MSKTVSDGRKTISATNTIILPLPGYSAPLSVINLAASGDTIPGDHKDPSFKKINPRGRETRAREVKGPSRSVTVATHLLDWTFFFGRQDVLKEQNSSPKISSSIPAYIHTHVYFVHIYEYIYAEIQFIWILWALQVSCPGCEPDPWAHIRVPHVQCVCAAVCAYLWHTYTPTYRSTSHPRPKIEKI